jgi:hypothetical protein
MRTERWIVGALVLCTLTACKHWDWSQTPNAAKEDDCKQYSVQESLGFYEKLLPPRGFYQVYALAEAADETTVPTRLPYSFIVFRVRDARFPDKKDPVVERIIGPVRSKEEWIDLFSVFRRYASSPPAGYYCWQDDCRGKYSPAGDPDPRDPTAGDPRPRGDHGTQRTCDQPRTPRCLWPARRSGAESGDRRIRFRARNRGSRVQLRPAREDRAQRRASREAPGERQPGGPGAGGRPGGARLAEASAGA